MEESQVTNWVMGKNSTKNIKTGKEKKFKVEFGFSLTSVFGKNSAVNNMSNVDIIVCMSNMTNGELVKVSINGCSSFAINIP